MRIGTVVAAALTMIHASSLAVAQDAPPEQVLRFKNLTVARVNPIGLINVLDGSYRWRLYGSKSPVFKDNFIGIGGQTVLTPAFFRVGPMVEIQPLSILQLQATFEAIDFFGSFDFFQSFQFAEDDWSDSARDTRGSSDDPAVQNYSTSGTQFTVRGELKFKVGPIAARNITRLGRPDFDLREGDQLYYDPLWDLLVPDEGWFMNSDTDVFYLTDFGLRIGARWTYARAFFEDKHFESGVAGDDPNNPTNRLGPFITYTFASKSPVFRNPTLLFIANWWLEHRFRTGADVSTALPYIILGLTFDGDLFTKPPPS